MKQIKKYILPLIFIVILVIADQWTKGLASAHLKGSDPIVLWDGVFELSYLENRGAAFGIFQNQKIFFVIITIIIVGFLVWFYSRIPDTKHYISMKAAVAVCVAGALGNFIDRMVNSYVVDFFYFKWIDFPIFNVADIYVTCSAAAFVILYLFVYNKEQDFDFIGKTTVRKDKQSRTDECSNDSSENDSPENDSSEENGGRH